MQTDDAYLGALLLLLIPAVLADVVRRQIPLIIPIAIGTLGCARAMTDAPRLATVPLCLAQALMLGALLAGAIWIFRRVRPRTATLGVGDAALLTAAATWVGISGCVAILVLASIALLVSVLVQAPWRGLDLKRPRSFGPGLALGLVLVLAVARLHTSEVRPTSDASSALSHN